jgi:hypothetical protein
MSQDPGSFDSLPADEDPGPGAALSFGLCLLCDFALVFLVFLNNLGSFVSSGSKNPIFVTLLLPLAVNGIAMRWGSKTKRERCLKGLIVATAFLVFLDSACVGLTF